MNLTMLRNLRLWVLWIAAALVLGWYAVTDPDSGAETMLRLQMLAWLVVAAGPVYLLRRALMERARSSAAYSKAMESPVGAGLVYLALAILTGLLFLAASARAEIPLGAMKYLPTLQSEISAHWPTLPMPSMLAAQIEQESLWQPGAKLKTEREYGFGLGQFTVAYRADGSERFNAWREVKALDAGLKDWAWEDRYDVRYQLRAVVVKNRSTFNRLRRLLDDNYNALAMTDAAYNGGLGGVLGERRLCAAVTGCDPRVWFGHVELQSTKSRVKWRGYGLSAYEINRLHVKNVLVVRRSKYVPLMGV